MDTIVDPNFSIVLPGGCNGRCKFCFWKEEKFNPHGFLNGLSDALTGLPEQFWKISITGGEPTLSPIIDEVLNMIREVKERWPKVVFTTNGAELERTAFKLKGVVDFVNISRHDINDNKNYEIFGTDRMIPTMEEIVGHNAALNRHGIETTANCVLRPDLDPREYIKFAGPMGFSAVCFRKPHVEGCTLEPTEQERAFNDHTPIGESSCPVCRSKTQLIRGMRVVWQTSIPEPSDIMPDEIYEVVLHPDGELYADWSKRIPLEIPNEEEKEETNRASQSEEKLDEAVSAKGSAA